MVIFILTIHWTFGLPDPGKAGKQCTLIRSPTDTGLCFLEPECNTVCNTVNEQQCRTENRQQCSTVNEQQCSIEQREQCSNVPEERCQVVNEQQCNTVNRQQCDQVLYNYITNAFLVFLGCFWAYVGKPQNHVG